MSVEYAVPNSKRYPVEDDYDIKEQLGDGQYSVVKLGVNKKTGEEVAIKFVHRTQTEPSEILNEVELMREVVDHPGFVRILDVYEDEKTYILVLDVVKGGELFDKIAQLTTYTEQRVAQLLHQIISALAYLHSKNIVHRDLKPENLLFGDQDANVIKLCDFGVAERIPEKGFLTEIIGTESYMAPEVEEGKPYGVASDIYGFGIIMYIMLCGYPPFEPENGITELEFPDEEWSDISKPAKDLITSLLDRDPDKRPTASEVLKHPWIRGEQSYKEDLTGTVKTMKIYNQYRASGNFAAVSMRTAKGSKKEILWALFGGDSKGSKAKGKPKHKKQDNPKPKVSFASKDKEKNTPQKKPKISMASSDKKPEPPPINASTDKKRTFSESPSLGVIPKFESEVLDEAKKKALSEEIQIELMNHYSKDPEELQQHVLLLESKLVSLSNINCALQSQIDDMISAYNKIKLERDDLKKERDDFKKERESIEKELDEIKKKKKEKK